MDKAARAFASDVVGVVVVPAAAAWECVLVVITFPHQAGSKSKDRVRSTGVVVDLVLAFFVFLEGDFAFRFVVLGEEGLRFFAWLIVGLDGMLELPLTIFFLVAVAVITSLAFPSPTSSADEKYRDVAGRLVPCEEK